MGLKAAPAPGRRTAANPEFPITCPPVPRLARHVVIALTFLAFAPAAASAASVDLAGASLRVTAAPGEANQLVLTSAGGVLTVADSGTIAVNAGLGCSQAAAARVTCSTTGVTSLVIDTGDGDDTLTLTGLTLPATLTDGPGDDTFVGGSGNDTFVGGSGNDALNGGPGTDSFGDAGGTGADVLIGGTGTDTADYSSRTVPLAVRLDDVPGDGAAGENDDVRSDVEIVNGGTAPDLLVGSAGANTLRGNGGEDIFDGRGGADSFAGGSGQDSVDYSSRGAAVTVTLDGTANDGEAAELDSVGTDVDIVLGGEGNDTLTGHSGTNELRGNGGTDALNGAGGDDVLRGGAGADRLDGGTANDTLDGGAGADNLIGSAGTDAADYSARTQAITGDLNGTTGFGEAGEDDTVAADVEGVYGGSADDQLTGNGSANVLRGYGGDDVLDGRLGADDVAGGDGIDSVSYAARTANVTVRLDGSAGDGQSGENDTIRTDVERLAGGSGDDKLYADDDPNVLVGNGGNDTIYGYGGNDVITVAGGADGVWGGAGDDAITGGDGANKLYGEDGNDTLASGGGADTVDGGAGTDSVTAGAGNDSASGGGGDDAVSAGEGNDKLSGGDGNDTLDAGGGDDSGDGGNGDDRITAGDGNDNLSGGEGIDWLDGSAGNDRLYGNNGNDNLDGGVGDDTLDGGAGDDGLAGADGNDTVNGSDGNDALDGAAANDTLNGGRGADTVSGGDGNDKVAGNEDNDTVTGGAGDDQVWGGSGDDTVSDGEGANKLYGDDGLDTVTGGPGNDSLSGGNGADLLDAGPGDDLLNGDNDNDRLQGGDGADKLAGAGGDDVLDGGLGPDEIDGADGTDAVDYGSRTGGVVVTNDGKADDGASHEGDNVATSIDDAIGSAGADRITFATDWPHKLDGGDGNDVLRGGDREDTLTGGRGKDALFGEGGADVYDGGAGRDHLSAADGVGERLLCGTGRDRAVLDKADKAVSCEKKTVKVVPSSTAPASAPRPSTPTPAHATAPTTTVKAPSGLIGVRRVASRGRFVAMPGSPGIRVDRRIVKDVAWILKHYKVRVTAGQEMSGHALHGEHPIGLALDIVPATGGSWDDVDRLAKWAEPRQNYPRPPFRWVGYNGDANHGRGNHLHLSWMHAATSPGRPAAWVVTMKFRRSGGAAGRAKDTKPQGTSRGAGALIRYSRSNGSLGKTLKIDSGIDAIGRCQGVGPLRPALKAASRAFGLDGWRILAALTETESGFGCDMGPSSAGAIGWTQFMPATWAAYGMDADGDGKADPYNSVDAVYSSARYLRASGAPGSWRKALFAYNHDTSYVNIVLARSKKY
jgi:Ca2+-binding RTX toxin-like protein